MTAARLALQLGARKSGSRWMARCPAHEDKCPSLSIMGGSDGQPLVHCHAGCSQDAVIGALRHLGHWSSSHRQTHSVIVATYNYTDENGKILYQIVRKRPKSFKQRYPDGSGGWIWKKHPHQVLYHLPEVLEAPIVFLVEGEKDVETLRSWGFVATTNAGGAQAPWLPEYTAALRGREVVLIPDNDPPGWARATLIARSLLGTVTRLVLLRLEGAKDISEWFDRGHSEIELITQLDDEVVRG